MNRVHAFRAVVVVILLLPTLLSAQTSATAQPAAKAPTQVQVQSPPEATVQPRLVNPQIVEAKFQCGNPSITGFYAKVKNIGSAAATFTGTLTITLPGACVKNDPTKNPDGTPCTADQMFCPGYCTQYAPDSTKAASFAPTKIAAGATATLSVNVTNQMIKSAVFKVGVQGKTAVSTKKLGAFSTCIF